MFDNWKVSFQKFRAGVMTHQVDALGSQTDGQRFIPRSHMVEGKNQLPQYVL